MPTLWNRTRAALIAATAVTVACEDQPSSLAPGEGPVGTERPGFVASAARGLMHPTPAVFVSLPPGSRRDGREVVVRNTAGGSALRRVMVDGGFDPLSLPAAPGDVISVEVVAGNGVAATELLVSLRIPPVIVRTSPAKRRSSVPLNSLLLVVFSEPVDPASVTSGTVRLVVNGRAEDVDLSVRDEGTVVVVSPRAPLTPSSDYTLEIDTGIQDLTGDHLARSEVVPFSTSSIVLTGGEPFAVRILPDTLRVPVNAISGFVVLVDSGARLLNVFPDTSVTWGSTDSAIVRTATSSGAVHALALGPVWVTAEYRGQVDSALVIVTTSPPPGPFSVFPDAATAPVGHQLTFDVRLPDTSPRPATTWSTTNPGIVAITAAGVATMVGPGTAFVVASDGSTTDSAEVEVYDPTPPLGWLYAIVPESTLLQVGDLWQMQLVGPGGPLPPVTWNTADPAIATIDAQGLLRAATPGTVLVTATFTDGSADSATVRVVPAGSLGRISLQPQSATAAVGDTVRLTLVYDSTATTMFGGQPFSWTVRSVGGPVLRILSGGVFEAIGPGTAEIRAYVGPLFTQTVTVVVSP